MHKQVDEVAERHVRERSQCMVIDSAEPSRCKDPHSYSFNKARILSDCRKIVIPVQAHVRPSCDLLNEAYITHNMSTGCQADSTTAFLVRSRIWFYADEALAFDSRSGCVCILRRPLQAGE
jgi:hypothetical protein